MKRLAAIVACVSICPLAQAAEATVRLDHAVVRYEGITEDYAQAVARTVEAARSVAAEQFGFDMPQTIEVSVRSDADAKVRLFNDGKDRFSLTVRSEQDLRRPSQSGIFHIYGLCHEVGHLAMYRPIRDHSWLTTAAAEGWAHYLGSRIVDAVHAREGAKLWPDRYDYLADGMARLKRQLGAGKGEPITRGSRAWMALGKIVGDKGFAPIFEAWGKAEVDPTDPGAAARKALLAANPDKRLSAWWNKAEGLFIFRRPKSGFAARTAPAEALTGRPAELAHDDGASAGKSSIAGSGHAVRFKVDGDGWYVTAVSLYGARYGYPQAPKEDFHVWLCDSDFKAIADFPFPYAKLTRGNPKWVTLALQPTNVPSEFIICAGFNPTATKGVFIHYDKEGSGNSLTGLPGGGSGAFSGGDWLIRAKVDRLKGADPLRMRR
jgi:hypothetical protein